MNGKLSFGKLQPIKVLRMNATPSLELATAQKRIGEELGVSPWVAIDQVKVNVFGEVTHWRTLGHCDPEYAETTPYGGTLMHGFHGVGLLSHFFKSAGLWPIDACDPLNYGLDKVRILKPIIIGEGLRLRSRIHLMEVTPKGNGEYLLKVSHHVEVEGAAEPVVYAEYLTYWHPLDRKSTRLNSSH